MSRIRKQYKKYSKETRLAAAEDYLSGGGSMREICKKYGISSLGYFSKVLLWYNGHREFRERTSAKGEIYMTKGRKTTQEERAEIVAFCIKNNYDYGLTVERYSVSYNQI